MYISCVVFLPPNVRGRDPSQAAHAAYCLCIKLRLEQNKVEWNGIEYKRKKKASSMQRVRAIILTRIKLSILQKSDWLGSHNSLCPVDIASALSRDR